MNLSNYDTPKLFKLQSEITEQLRINGVIRTKNIKGDVGEHLTVNLFEQNKSLPKLTLTVTGSKYIDAIDSENKTYSIKTITTPSTSCFYGLEPPDSLIENEKRFDYLIITHLNPDWTIKRMLRLSWNQFLFYKSWHSTMRGWKITTNRKIVNDADILLG